MTTVHDDAPVGVFDSGVGGLSVLQAIRRELPDEHLCYVADSGHAPYGDRDAGFIGHRAAAITRFLLARGAKAIVIACNTASVVAVKDLRSWCPVPVVAMEPAIKPAARWTRTGVVGVLATRQTLASANVARLCEIHGRAVDFLLQPCPGLVEQVERAELATPATRSLLAGYVAPLLAAGADTLVLGCTHYPFLAPLLRDLVGPAVRLVDPAPAVARQLARRLDRLRRAGDSPAQTRFFSTAPLADARATMAALWAGDVSVDRIAADDPPSEA